MRIALIPLLVLQSASLTSICTIAVPKTCEALVPSIGKSRAEIFNISPRVGKRENWLTRYQKKNTVNWFLKSTKDVSDASVGSIDDIESRISAMKVIELRAELKSHGHSTNGLKKILQQRLLDFYMEKYNSFKEEDKLKEINLANYGNGMNGDEDQRKDVILETNDGDLEDNSDTEIYDVEDEFIPSGLLDSKQKWKKKTYLLMEDVRKLLHSKDAVTRQRAPKKAGDTVRRIQRWISLSSDKFDVLDSNAEGEEEEGDDEIKTIIDFDADGFLEFQKFQRSSLLRAYNLWIHVIAKSGLDDAGNRAEQVLYEMQKNTSSGGPPPNEVTIASVMDAHAHSASLSSSKGGAKAAESFLFEFLEDNGANDDVSDVPWSQDGVNSLRDSFIVTCDTMLNALAKEGTIESAERAQIIVLRLEDYQRQKEKRNRENRSKNSRRNSTSGSEKATQSTSSKKRPISYATVMNAWANVGTAEAAKQAEVTLESLVQRAKADKKDNKNQRDERLKLVDIQPDTVVFNSVIQCWATSGDIRAGKKSLRLLEQMKELAGISTNDKRDERESKIIFYTHPDIITYNTVLSAWSHCGKKNAAIQAEKIVKELVAEQHKNQGIDSETGEKIPVVANTITFNSVLHAWSKSKLPGATDRAEKLLEYMIRSRNSEVKPDIYSFTCVMDAWAKSKEPNKALHTRQLLDRLIEMRRQALEKRDRCKADALQPTQIPYNTVLNACAFSAMDTPEKERRKALQIAVDTYKAMSSRVTSFRRRGNEGLVSRDTVTYGLMLKSIANLMPKGDSRSRIALQIFRECCDDGLVGFLVWNEVRRAVPIKLLDETYRLKRHCGSIEVKDLPEAWKVNCTGRRPNQQRQKRGNNRKRKSRINDNTHKNPSENQIRDNTFIIERSFATGKDL